MLLVQLWAYHIAALCVVNKVTPAAPPSFKAYSAIVVSALQLLPRGSEHITSSMPHTQRIDSSLLIHSVGTDVVAAGLAFIAQALQCVHT